MRPVDRGSKWKNINDRCASRNQDSIISAAVAWTAIGVRGRSIHGTPHLQPRKLSNLCWNKKKKIHHVPFIVQQESNSSVPGQLGSSLSIAILLHGHIRTQSQFVCWHCQIAERFLSRAGRGSIWCCGRPGAFAQISKTRTPSYRSAGNWLVLNCS